MSELTSPVVPGTTPQAPTEPQPAAPAVESAPGTTPEKPRPDNLYEIPEFRQFQAAVVSPMQRQLQEYQQRLHQMETANLEPEERLAYDNRTMQQQLQQTQQELESMRIERQKQTDLANLSRDYGVPVEQLADAESYADARLKAVELKYKKDIEELRRQSAPEDNERRYEPGPVDLGGGRAPSTAQEYDRQLAAAKKAGSKQYYALLMQGPPE